MHWCFLINYVCLLWLCRTGFGINFGLELCGWPWKYSAWFYQTLTANEWCQIHCQSLWASRDYIQGDIGLARNPIVRIMWGQTRGFCERKFAWVPGEISQMCWKTKSSARQYRRRLHLISPTRACQTLISRAPYKWSLWRCLFTPKHRKKHSTGDAGGMTSRSCRCGAPGSQANPPLQQQTFHLRLARDRRVILCQDNEGGATQRQKAICLASGEDVIGNDSPPCCRVGCWWGLRHPERTAPNLLAWALHRLALPRPLRFTDRWGRRAPARQTTPGRAAPPRVPAQALDGGAVPGAKMERPLAPHAKKL